MLPDEQKGKVMNALKNGEIVGGRGLNQETKLNGPAN
jgi:hypothetical protein